MLEDIEKLRIEVIRAIDEVFQEFFKQKNLILVKLDEKVLEKETREIAELIYDFLDRVKNGKVKEVWFK